MITINDIFRNFAPKYIEHFPNMPRHHRKVINAIINCRSGEYGTTVYHCRDCGKRHFISRSCGNRHCPQCQYHKTQAWLEKQLKKQVPGQHFLITFTLPEEIRSLARQNQLTVYKAIFKASSLALKKLAKDKRFIGTNLPGFTGVLHTWGRQLQYHPHVHYIVAGGGLSDDRSGWIPSRKDFYVHLKPLSIIFRAIFMKEMEKAGLKKKIPSFVWEKDWVVDSQAVQNADNSIRYLAPYVFRVAISNRRIVKVENGFVYFKYRKHASKQIKTMCLKVMEFIHRFLQHVLPSGFMKIRHFGFMNPNCSIDHSVIDKLIEARTGETLTKIDPPGPVPLYCPDCGGKLFYLWSIIPMFTRRE